MVGGLFDLGIDGSEIKIKLQFPNCMEHCQMCGFAIYEEEERAMIIKGKLKRVRVPVITCKIMKEIMEAEGDGLAQFFSAIGGLANSGKTNKKESEDDGGED